MPQLLAFPGDVVERQSGHFVRAQTVCHEEQQNSAFWLGFWGFGSASRQN
jgi:hypothetical protein